MEYLSTSIRLTPEAYTEVRGGKVSSALGKAIIQQVLDNVNGQGRIPGRITVDGFINFPRSAEDIKLVEAGDQTRLTPSVSVGAKDMPFVLRFTGFRPTMPVEGLIVVAAECSGSEVASRDKAVMHVTLPSAHYDEISAEGALVTSYEDKEGKTVELGTPQANAKLIDGISVSTVAASHRKGYFTK